MRLLLSFSLITLIMILAMPKANAQDLTGIWRGYFITEYSDQYKFEIQVAQNKTNRITGVSYSYLDTRFYGKATLTGFTNKANKTALIQEIKTVEIKMSSGSVACIMKCNVTYTRSGNEEFLEGTYTSAYEKTSENEGVKKGGNCGGGKIFLRKVITSDFYVEPFLKDQPVTKQSSTPVIAPKTLPKSNTSGNKPVTKTPVKTPPAKTPPTKITDNKPKPEKKETVNAPKANEVNIPKKEDAPVKTIIPKAIQIPAQTRSRSNELTKTVIVTNQEITVKLYDNGVIDNDTISVYHNGKPILMNKMLTASPLTITLKLDEEHPEHVLIMVAENMGSIPPNTSLMVVHDGDKRYEVSITSTEQKNAMVRFRYQKRSD